MMDNASAFACSNILLDRTSVEGDSDRLGAKADAEGRDAADSQTVG